MCGDVPKLRDDFRIIFERPLKARLYSLQSFHRLNMPACAMQTWLTISGTFSVVSLPREKIFVLRICTEQMKDWSAADFEQSHWLVHWLEPCSGSYSKDSGGGLTGKKTYVFCTWLDYLFWCFIWNVTNCIVSAWYHCLCVVPFYITHASSAPLSGVYPVDVPVTSLTEHRPIPAVLGLPKQKL